MPTVIIIDADGIVSFLQLNRYALFLKRVVRKCVDEEVPFRFLAVDLYRSIFIYNFCIVPVSSANVVVGLENTHLINACRRCAVFYFQIFIDIRFRVCGTFHPHDISARRRACAGRCFDGRTRRNAVLRLNHCLVKPIVPRRNLPHLHIVQCRGSCRVDIHNIDALLQIDRYFRRPPGVAGFLQSNPGVWFL